MTRSASAHGCLFVALETLTPAERLAFVHDMFAVPFDEIAPTDRAVAGPLPGCAPA